MGGGARKSARHEKRRPNFTDCSGKRKKTQEGERTRKIPEANAGGWRLARRLRSRRPANRRWMGDVCGRGGGECLASRVSWLVGDSFYCLLSLMAGRGRKAGGVVVGMIRTWQSLFLSSPPSPSLSLYSCLSFSLSSLQALSLLRLASFLVRSGI